MSKKIKQHLINNYDEIEIKEDKLISESLSIRLSYLLCIKIKSLKKKYYNFFCLQLYIVQHILFCNMISF